MMDRRTCAGWALVLVWMGLVGGGALADPGDFSLDIDRIRYSDSTGLIVDYGFDAPAQSPAPVHHSIPGSAVTSPIPFWNASTFVWSDGGDVSPDLQGELTGSSYRQWVPQRSPVKLEPNGLTSMGLFSAGNLPAPALDWQYEARLNNFTGLSQLQTEYRFEVGTGGFEDAAYATVEGSWASGSFQGMSFTNLLIISMTVRTQVANGGGYHWEYADDGPTGEPIFIFGLDPATVNLDLKLDVTGGRSFTGLYRINSDSPGDWQTIDTHTIPLGELLGPGVFGTYPLVVMANERFDPDVPGDYNGDGVVDPSDYAYWSNQYAIALDGGVPEPYADGNGDGVVDPSDYAVWSNEYAASLGDVTPNVPEPTTLGVMGLAMAAIFRPRRSG